MQGRPVPVEVAILPAPPCEADIRTELERILSSPDLQASERRRKFLRFVVEETLAGRSASLKGYTVALAVFRRDETFDSQADPVVRLEARRLRRDLDSYYVGAGSRNPLRISIPKGSYVPHFEWHENAPLLPASAEVADVGEPDTAEEIDSGGPGLWARAAAIVHANKRAFEVAAFLLTLSVLAAVSWLHVVWNAPATSPGETGTGGPAIAVMPFEPLGSTEDGRYLAAGISEELLGELMRFPGFRLYTSALGRAKTADATSIELGKDLNVSYIVRGSVRQEARDVRVTAQLVDAGTGQVLWSRRYDRPYTPQALMSVESDLAGEIATALGQPYGVVNTDLYQRPAAAGGLTMPSYICVQRAYGYRRTFSREEFNPVLVCLEEAVRRDPRYSDAWAMLGWLYLDAGRFEFFGQNNLQDQYDKAFEAASEAVRLAPDNTTALKALASINHYRGNFDEGERLARRAVELNPHDPDALVQLGWRLAVRGKFDEGIPLVQRAIDRTANPPGWYFHTLVIDRYMKGDYEQALLLARRAAKDGGPIGAALVAVANGALADGDAARAALEEMSRFPRIARDPGAYFRRHGATEEIVDAIVAGLEKARDAAAGS